MKKIVLILLISLMPIVANAERVIKVGASVLYGNVEGHKFALVSAEFKIEKSIYRNLGAGFGFRKETRWGYSGYYFSLYPMYKTRLSKNCFIATSLGVEYGIASSEYDRYDNTTYDESGNLITHKWIYLVQNIPFPGDFVKGNTGIIYPFTTISGGVWISKLLSVEVGIKAQILRFGIKSCNFDPITWDAYDIRDEKVWRIVPSAFIQIGIKLPNNKLRS